MATQRSTPEDDSLRHQQGTFPRNGPETPSCSSPPEEDPQKYGEDKLLQVCQDMSGIQDASHVWKFDSVQFDLWRAGAASQEPNTVLHCSTVMITW